MASKPAVHSDSLWFEHLSPVQNPSVRLFCFAYAGGNPLVFRPWRKNFPAHVDVCLVQLPGRGRRFGEKAFTRMEPLVEILAHKIHAKLDCPFAFYGHSMGASIGFELAREVRRQYGVEPVHLLVSGRRAPHIPDSDPPTYNLPDDQFVAELKRLNGTPLELLENPETTQIFLPLLRADFELVDTYMYRPGERLSCPITAYGGIQDKDVPAGSLRGWQEHTSGAFKTRMFPGDHFFIIHSSNTSFLEHLCRDLMATVK